MSWRVIYIEDSDKLTLYLDNLKITKGDNELLVPLSDINSLIINNYKILLSVHLLNAITKHNVNLVLCGVDHLPQSIVKPLFGHSQTSLILRNQLEWDEQLKEEVHRLIVINKINNQISILEKVYPKNERINMLRRFINEVKPGDSGNREGLSAKVYFTTLFGKDFIRFNDDVINAGLNYGYAILRSQIARTLIAKGLNTSLGIFHIGRSNRFNLCDDIIEPLRPIVDYWVKNNLEGEKIFTREHRLSLIKLTTGNARIQKTIQTIVNTINIYTDSLIRVFEEKDLSKYQMIDLYIDEQL